MQSPIQGKFLEDDEPTTAPDTLQSSLLGNSGTNQAENYALLSGIVNTGGSLASGPPSIASLVGGSTGSAPGGYRSSADAIDAAVWSSIMGGSALGAGSSADEAAPLDGPVPAITPDDSGNIPGTPSYDIGQLGAQSGPFDSETQAMVKEVENSLKTLWNAQTMKGSQSDFEAECSQIAVAYVNMFSQNETWRLRPGNYNSGQMCYQWQTLTANALEPIVQNSNYFYIARVGLVTQSPLTAPGLGSLGEPEPSSFAEPPGPLVLQHNWVAISTTPPGRSVWQVTPPGPSTLYFDPWIGNGPVVFRYTGTGNTGYEGDHPIPNYVGTPYGADPLKPEGTEGYYTPPGTPPGGVPVLHNFPGWTW